MEKYRMYELICQTYKAHATLEAIEYIQGLTVTSALELMEYAQGQHGIKRHQMSLYIRDILAR
jgi:hypothetical protein